MRYFSSSRTHKLLSLPPGRVSGWLRGRWNPAPLPSVSSFTPAVGVSGTPVVITGTGFLTATGVKFNGVSSSSFVINSDTQITALASASATPTLGTVAVFTDGGSAVSSGSFLNLSTKTALWLDASKPASLFQDLALTVPAVADADPTGGWKDFSGFNRHLTQSFTTKRPTLKLAQQNGLPLVIGDGVDDFLKATFTLAQPTYIAIVAAVIARTALGKIHDGGVTNTGLFYQPDATHLGIFAGNTTDPNVAYTASTASLFEVFFSGSSSYLRINGVTTNSSVTPGVVSMGGLTLFARADGAGAGRVGIGEVIAETAEPTA